MSVVSTGNTAQLEFPKLVSGSAPIVGHTFQYFKDPIGLITRGVQEHGEMFALKLGNRKVVVLVGPENSKFFFNQTDKVLSTREAYPFFLNMFNKDFYFFAEYDQYLKQKSLVMPKFQGKALESYVDLMSYETERMCQDKLGDEGVFDLIPTIGPLVMNIAAHSFLGEDFRTRLGDQFFEDFRDFSAAMDPVTPNPILKLLPKYARSQKAKRMLHKMLGDLINDRRKNPVEKHDFLQTLADAKYPDGTDVPLHIQIDLILLLVWAGHETTAGHTSWAFVDILRNSKIVNKLREEQDKYWEKGSKLTFENCRNFDLCDWSLRETERLHPVAYILSRMAVEDIELNGHLIPKGTFVFAAPCVSHKLPYIFSNPEQWDPYRYSPERNETKGFQNALIGFGGGTHRCAGVNFAYLEMKVIVSIMLRYYDLELIDKSIQEAPGVVTKWVDSPCRVRYTRRKDIPRPDLSDFKLA